MLHDKVVHEIIFPEGFELAWWIQVCALNSFLFMLVSFS
jgi:hypothetical protein